MNKMLFGALAVFLLIPLGFVALIGGPQAVTEANGIATACQLELGIAPQPDSTVGQLGGADAAAVAAALTQAAGTAPVSDTSAPTTTASPVPAQAVAAGLVGDRAYEFVTTLNSLDNWRTLPVAAVARWALDPAHVAPPAGAVPLPPLPAEQTTAMQTDEQPSTAYARGCAAVVARATAATVHPAGDANGHAIRPDVAALRAMAGTPQANLDLLRAINPTAAQDDPRQFYLDYRPHEVIAPGDVVVYDYTIGGPAHFGIALDDLQMLTTGSVAGGVAYAWPIPVNRGVMTARPVSGDDEATSTKGMQR